ncbi:hypothetical protein [Streptomyces melanosporofaciens]|nr:hypothetical protein [Streptomyces melanosporofaciens]
MNCHPGQAPRLGSSPGLRTEAQGHLMLTCLTDVRGERIVVLQGTWFG